MGSRTDRSADADQKVLLIKANRLQESFVIANNTISILLVPQQLSQTSPRAEFFMANNSLSDSSNADAANHTTNLKSHGGPCYVSDVGPPAVQQPHNPAGFPHMSVGLNAAEPGVKTSGSFLSLRLRCA